MYGAIFGDIIGSRFEFTKKRIPREFTLFSEKDDFTDDTVMTIAVAEALLDAGKEATLEEIRSSCVKKMREWGKKYPHAGYGGSFRKWLWDEKAGAYNSFGNGSAMRVSAAGWLYDSIERTREVAKATAEVTHDHPEGIKGAECTAAAIYLARTGATKEEIKTYVIREFGYPMELDMKELAKRKEHPVSCQDSVPKALAAFLEGKDYESTVRNAVCLGGDTDTVAAIAGSIAEAFYEIPIGIVVKGLAYLDDAILEVADRFDQALGRQEENEEYRKNQILKNAIEVMKRDETGNIELLLEVFSTLLFRMEQKGEVPAAMIDENHLMETLDLDQLKVGDSISFDREVRLVFAKLVDEKGDIWIPLYTDEKELNRGPAAEIQINILIENVLRAGLESENVKGVVINPFGQQMKLEKDILGIVMERFESVQKEEI